VITVANEGFYVKPVRQASSTGLKNVLWYNTTVSGAPEICCDTSKQFVINHPVDPDKYLVHACLEGPEAGVYYRGKGEIVNGVSTTIVLPDYVDAFAYNFTVHVTHLLEDEENEDIDEANIVQLHYSAGNVKEGKFKVYGPNGKFYWVVYGQRLPVNVEPLKSSVEVKGTGPYRWI
jgi:hypothetical protein